MAHQNFVTTSMPNYRLCYGHRGLTATKFLRVLEMEMKENDC